MDQPSSTDTRQRHAPLETVKVRHPDNPDEVMTINRRDYETSKGKYELYDEPPETGDPGDEGDEDSVVIPQDWKKLNMPELKALADELQIEHEGLNKGEIQAAIQEMIPEGDN